MNRLMKILYSVALGAWAAFAGWLILNFVLNYRGMTPYIQSIVSGALVGLLTGALIAGFEKFNDTSRAAPTAVGALLGVLTGLVGGIIGLLIGQALFDLLPSAGALKEGLRVVGWGVFGLGVGLGPGIATLSLRKLAFGAAGGCLGGMIGGGIFLLLLGAFTQLVMTASAIGFTLLGLFAGLFIALAQEVAKQATLKITQQIVRTSRNYEGTRFTIAKKRVSIGSANGDDWIIPEDPNVLPHHVDLRQEAGRFVLYSNISTSPAIVRGQPISRHVLADDDRFQVGGTIIGFTTK